ncbi:MAG: hypothetical protein M1826_005987 [Phylliscum demangeonii]|nr:MAG: hypothetical protein M1826_005987 [Phylliscum demangeonii]
MRWVDDILAILLALAAGPDEIEVVLLSVVFGNINVEALKAEGRPSCLRNLVSMFHVLEKERQWRRQQGRAEGFESARAYCPLVAVGAEKPLAEARMMAEYYHGHDGLGGIHSSHPHFTPDETWKKLFHSLALPIATVTAMAPPPTPTLDVPDVDVLAPPTYGWKASQEPAHRAILRVLRENERDSITIVAIGPLTNIALAAAEDSESFLRVRELVVMGGAIDRKGNVTPVAEFNLAADAVAAARVFALTAARPSSTMPPAADHRLPPYPEPLSRTLPLTLFPLDLTTEHVLEGSEFADFMQPLVAAGSPLASWVKAFVQATFERQATLHMHPRSLRLSLHDPLCVWYTLTQSSSSLLAGSWRSAPASPEDIRVEAAGQWTRGMCVLDRRERRRTEDPAQGVPGDAWLGRDQGNRVRRMVASPGGRLLARCLLERIFQ